MFLHTSAGAIETSVFLVQFEASLSLMETSFSLAVNVFELNSEQISKDNFRR